MINEIADAVAAISKVAYEMLHKTQRQLIDDAYQDAQADVTHFKQTLLENNSTGSQLLLDGLMYGIRAHITSSEYQQLNNTSLNLNAYSLLGLYCRARGAEFAQRICQIVQTEPLNP